MFRLETDITEFADLTSVLQGAVRGEVGELARDLEEDAESYALDKIQEQIYDTPLRFFDGDLYVRTGLLKRSIRAVSGVTADELTLALTTGPGAGGKRYGRDNELGRGRSAVTLERVLADARALADPLDLGPYRRVDDLEPRPFLTPAIAKLEDELEERLLTFIEEAAR